MLNIAIIGAGIMGRVLAWKLCQHHNVSLYDQDPIATGQAAAYTAAGMLSPFSELESAENLIFELGMQSLPLWKQLMQELNASHLLNDSGSIIVAHTNDRPDHQRFIQQLHHKLPDGNSFRSLNSTQLHTLEPELCQRFNDATFLPQEASVDAEATMQQLANHLLANPNVQWYAEIAIHALEAHTVSHNNKRKHYDWVIDCRGLGAKQEMPELRGVRGEVMWFHAPDVSLTHVVRLMHPRYRLYIVPRANHHYVIGATQIESDDMGPITVRSALELLSATYSIHSGFAEAQILQTKTNCRPALRNNLPRIQVSPGLMRINGLFRHGFLLAPILAHEAIEALQSVNYQSPFEQLIDWQQPTLKEHHFL
ncbi:glycine oxidase ThiO [Pleionea sp. CnH1-48]|uniref:glycine oxidase ThiO n=1 Tax=Pleionea sp. CnH1-48 TaxID=2954494 RepID=UPI002096D4AE|nr:glycine oxidase ThiO [Pleionea sp. CnH1-48]MCO7223867.1 glycine oxidase ThiO [Pleionea sp. CnH1-48]